MKCIICNKDIDVSRYSNKVLCSSECFTIDYWNDKVAIKDNANSVRIAGEQYYIGDENDKGGFRGFDGRKFIIRFNNGREVITTNLWYNGEIPEEYKDKLPDNAIFVRGN